MTADQGIRDIRDHWERQARLDPLWAILSDPAKKGRKWQAADFFETGRREISVLMFRLRAQGIPVAHGQALDFGCGIGRLSQALVPHFDRVAGVDISETMIKLAGLANQFPGKVRYFRSEDENLGLFGDAEFDFIYTNIVLQHIRPEIVRGYWGGFRRVLKPGGLLIFQLPSHRRAIDAAGNGAAPMAPEAYAARISLGEIPAPLFAPSERITLEVRVRNASPRDWVRSEAAPVRVANHWLSSDGRTMLVQDDGRADLPAVVKAGEECLVFLAVTTPPEQGDYRLEVDLVHEMVAWFKERGSPTAQSEVRVRTGAAADVLSPKAGATDFLSPSAGPSSSELEERGLDEKLKNALPREAGDPDDAPMFGIPRADVVDFFASRGDSVLQIDEDSHAGREWVGFRYYVRRSRES
jgi:SAM-dependent methyltransferase